MNMKAAALTNDITKVGSLHIHQNQNQNQNQNSNQNQNQNHGYHQAESRTDGASRTYLSRQINSSSCFKYSQNYSQFSLKLKV